MKQFKRIVGSITLLAASAGVQAGPIEDIFGQGQAQMNKQFESISDDLASVFSYKAVSPAASLAGGIIPVGFDVALDVSATKLKKDSILIGAFPDSLQDMAYIPFPKGHVQVGIAIPFIPFVPAIDVGVQYMNFPGVFNHMGGELKVNIAGGNILLPAVAIRGVFSNTGVTVDDKSLASIMTYGAELTDALHAMAERWQIDDIKMFVVCLSVQNETGGNLAEILENLSDVIRARASMYMKVRALSSEGRMTGWLLGVLPVFTLVMLFLVNPKFYLDVATDPIFYISFPVMILWYLFGIYLIRRMIDLKV